MQYGFTKHTRCLSVRVKTIPNPKDDKTQNDARHHIYPLECLKPEISHLVVLKNKWKLLIPTQNPYTLPDNIQLRNNYLEISDVVSN